MDIKTVINGETRTLEVFAGESLAAFLRRYDYKEVRTGCDTGSCGLCTVWLDGKPVLSCSTLAARIAGRRVTTIKGVGTEGETLAKFLVAEGADQCGYCSPGFIMTVLSMKKEIKEPTEEAIKHYLNGNLCRCTGYEGQTRAIKKWLESSKGA